MGIFFEFINRLLENRIQSQPQHPSLPDLSPMLKSSAKKLNIPPYDPEETDTIHTVMCMTPWGEVFPVVFTSEQWGMVHELAALTQKPVEEVIAEVAADRYFGGTMRF